MVDKMVSEPAAKMVVQLVALQVDELVAQLEILRVENSVVMLVLYSAVGMEFLKAELLAAELVI